MQNTGTGLGFSSQQIKVDYSKVAERMQSLKSRAEAEAGRISNEYTFVLRKLNDRDSFTNATLIEVSKENERKAHTMAKVFSRLSLFIAKASEHTEHTENVIASQFNK